LNKIHEERILHTKNFKFSEFLAGKALERKW